MNSEEPPSESETAEVEILLDLLRHSHFCFTGVERLAEEARFLAAFELELMNDSLRPAGKRARFVNLRPQASAEKRAAARTRQAHAMSMKAELSAPDVEDDDCDAGADSRSA